MADDASSPLGSQALDLVGQFMVSLTETMKRLALMYTDCPRTQAHVAEILKHVDEDRTRQRSVKMWHRAMQPHYVSIAQTKDQERRDKAVRAALEANWFFAQMDMATKWQDPSFDPSRERFVNVIRVLNGLAFMEHSFLGKLSEALRSITAKMSARGGGIEALDTESIFELLPEIMGLVNQDTLQEINRMLPHVVYVVGGKEKLLAMLDSAVGESGPMKAMMGELLATMMPSTPAADEATPKVDDVLDRGLSTVRDIFEKIADPDNESSLTDVLESFGVNAASTEDSAPMSMNADAIRSAFEGLMEQFGEGSGAVGAIGNVLRQQFQEGGAGEVNAEELTSLAAEALRVQGIEVDDSQLEAVKRLTSAFGKMNAETSPPGETAGAAAGAAAEPDPIF
jgi:hypothetical protein